MYEGLKASLEPPLLPVPQAPENYSYGLAHKKQKDRYIAQVVRLCGPALRDTSSCSKPASC